MSITLLFFWFLSALGAVDPCEVPELANGAYAEECEGPSLKTVNDLTGVTDISNGF